MNKKTIEALIKAGAFDSTGYTRKHLMTLMEETVDASLRKRKDIDAGQGSIFDLFAAEELADHDPVVAPNGDEWDKKIKLKFEKDMLGIYVSDHPLREIADEVRRGSDHSLAEVDELCQRDNRLVGRPAGRGGPQAHQEGHDDGGRYPRGPRGLHRDRHVPAGLRPLPRPDRGRRGAAGQGASSRSDDRGVKLVAAELEPFDGGAFAAPPQRIIVETDAGALTNGRASALKEILSRYPGRDFVELAVCDQDKCSTKTYRLDETVDARSGGPSRRAARALRPGSMRGT